MQNPIDPIADAQIVFQRLDMNVGCTFDDGLANNLVYEFDDGRLRIVRIQVGARLSVLQHLEGAVRLQNFIESFRADAIESLDCAQELRTRHEHPFRRLLQELRSKLTAH